MTMHCFVDRAGALGQLERTPQGGHRAPARIARVGVQKYLAGALRRQGVELGTEFRDSDMVSIYMPPDVLEAALDSMRDAPVTNEHPPRFVTPETFRSTACGHVQPDTLAFDGQYLTGKLVVQDADLLRDIELNQRRGVSPGYRAITDFTPGTTPDGQPYHARRVKVEYNHCAVVTNPRGGETVCLALDSDEIPQFEEENPVKLKIRGAEVAAENAQPVIDSVEGQLTGLTAEVDSLRSKCAQLESELAAARSPETIAKYVQDAKDAEARVAERTKRVDAVKAAFPTVALDGKSDEFVDGLYAAIPADPDGLQKLAGKGAPVVKAVDSKPTPRQPSARERMIAANRAMILTTDNTAE